MYEIPFGGAALDPAKFYNRRSEMWFLLREWIRAGGAIPNESGLVGEISSPLYGFDAKGRITLEKKDEIKARLGRSPDLADSLALTFALPVLPETAHRQQYADRQTNLLSDYETSPYGGYADGISAPLI